MANFTATEQLMLELTNRARMDPVGEAKRMGIGLNDGIAKGAISTAPKQVMAGSDILLSSARAHSSWMIKTDTFSHFESGRTETATMRMQVAGYKFTGAWSNGENIALVGTSGELDLVKSIIQQHKDLFLSTHGHRENMLGDAHREAGIGQIAGDYKGYNTSMVTQNFATTGTDVFITGVVYNDTKTNDNFFTVGEQVVRMKVSSDALSDTTGAGGGYELDFASGGTKNVTFATSAGAATVQVVLGDDNIKIDLVNGNEIWTNASVTSLTGTIREIHALGISRMNIVGNSAAEKLFGNAAANVIRGGGGADVLTGGGGGDRFSFKLASDSAPERARDTIMDFGVGADKIDLSAVFGGGELRFRGAAAINDANQVSFTASGSDVIVHVNLDSDMQDEMQIRLVGVSLKEMTLSDFIL